MSDSTPMKNGTRSAHGGLIGGNALSARRFFSQESLMNTRSPRTMKIVPFRVTSCAGYFRESDLDARRLSLGGNCQTESFRLAQWRWIRHTVRP